MLRTSFRVLAAGSILVSSAVVSAEPVAGLTTDNRIVLFDHATPGTIMAMMNVTGLAPGETLLGIDQRPVSGEVFAMGSSNRLYTISLATGAATPVGGAPFAPGLTPGVEYGVDFNPTVDRWRVTGSNGENRRLNPETGAAVATDPNLTYAAGGTPRAVAVAYTNSVPNAPVGSTRQFIIDSALGILGETGSQAGGNASFNAGVVTPIGSLGVPTTDLVGFDIGGNTGLVLVSLTSPMTGFSSLYTLDLSAGSATLIGAIGADLTLRDITIVPAPGAVAALGAGVIVLTRRRR